MPGGKVHDQITIIGAALAAPVWWALTPPPQDWTVGLTLVGTTLVSGLLLSPDLDLDSSIYRRWGPFRFLWWPYQKAVPHRSKISHSLILGPLLRIVYFLFVLWLLFRIGSWALVQFIPMDRNSLSRQATDAILGVYSLYPQHTVAGAIGLFLGTFLHVAADTISSGFKRKKRGGR